MRIVSRILDYPHPLRLALRHKVRSRLRGFQREHYLTCVQRAAQEATAIGHDRLTVIEFGVAQGRGLLELERICAWIEARYPLRLDLFGFDTGAGLPKPTDYRDTPWKWTEGWYRMDEEALRRKLTRANLVLGDVAETVPEFIRRQRPSPIGAVMFDLDYYSATKKALQIFAEGDPEGHLCRVLCYFDDIGSIEDVGVARAIMEFNAENERRKIKPHLFWKYHPSPYIQGWKIYDFHHFDHPFYKKLSREENRL